MSGTGVCRPRGLASDTLGASKRLTYALYIGVARRNLNDGRAGDRRSGRHVYPPKREHSQDENLRDGILRPFVLRLGVPGLAHFRAAAAEVLSAGTAFLARALVHISMAGERAV